MENKNENIENEGSQIQGRAEAASVAEPKASGETELKPSSYRWVMLACFSLICFLMSFCQFQPAFFAQDIMRDFGVDTQGFTWMTAFPLAVGLFLALVIGSLTDKFGLRRSLFVAMVITSAGAIARYYCQSYVMLLLMSATLGIAATFTTTNMTKMAMTWFPPKQVGLAVGLMNAVGAAGLAFAQGATGVLFADYRSAFLIAGIACAVVTVIWVIFARDRRLTPNVAVEPEEKQDEQKKGSFKTVVKSRGVWLAGLGGAFYNGFNITAGSLLITALVVYWGTDPVQAGVMSALFTIGIMVGDIALPTLIPRSRKAKVLCVLLPILFAITIFAGWYINVPAARYVLFPLAGIFFGGTLPIFMSYPSVLPEINHENAGTAGGLLTTIMMAGAVVLPTLVITPIAGSDYNLLVILSTLITLLNVIPFALLPSIHREK